MPSASLRVPQTGRVHRGRCFTAAPAKRQSTVTVRAEAWNPPPVSDTKNRFTEAFKRPLPSLYSGIMQELLVQQHLFRWNKDYKYSEVTALGMCSIFEQVLGGLPEAEREDVFTAFIGALQEDPAKYKADAAKLGEWAKAQTDLSSLKPDANGNEGQQILARVAEATASKSFLYTKFFAIGVFRMLELAGVKDPKALSTLVTELGIPVERVNADLLTYKGVLSKLQSAKEIMKEFMEREKKKAAEREAEKAAKAEAKASAVTETA